MTLPATTPLQRALLTVLTSVAVTACTSGPQFAVGDCVTLEPSAADFGLEVADCEDNQDSEDVEITPEGIYLGVYRVEAVLERDDTCALDGPFGDVGLDHEADDVLYCLTPNIQ